MRELVILAVALEVLGDLRREFARRLEDQGARHARLGAAARQDLDHRQGEGGGLAGAGLGDADDVAALEHLRDGLGLDRRRRGVAGVGDGLEDLRAEAEILETNSLRVSEGAGAEAVLSASPSERPSVP